MAAGVQTTANTTGLWSDLTLLAPIVWVEGARIAVEELQPVMDLYDVDPLNEFNRDYSSIAESGFGNVVTEGADYQAGFNNQGDNLSLTVVKRGAMFTITEDLVDGNKYREIRIGMQDLGGRLFRSRARDATHVGFTFAFSSSYVDADGRTVTSTAIAKGSEATFADTHTMGDASTFDNNLADTPIAEASLRNLEDLTVDFADENGNLVSWGLGGKVLVTGMDVGMQHAGLRLTNQAWQYQNSNRDINPFADQRAHGGAFTHLPLFFLSTTAAGGRDTTKEKYYFILDRAKAKNSMIFGNHTNPTPMGPYRDIYNAGHLWQSKTRYDIGILYAHHGAGCPATS